MKIQRTDDGGFRLEGDIENTFQLLFEALEIAAASEDPYAPDFGALSEQLMLATAHWLD